MGKSCSRVFEEGIMNLIRFDCGLKGVKSIHIKVCEMYLKYYFVTYMVPS